MPIRRRRGAELEQAISAAVMAELRDCGYPGLTYDGVATRAGTSKPVLYRRWPSKAEMVMAAVMLSTNEAIASPDTGAFETDLEALLSAMRYNFSPAHRSAMLGMLTELDDDGAEALRGVIFRWGKALVEPLVQRAQKRGELGGATLPPEVLALPLDLARHELAMRGVLSDARLTAIVHVLSMPLMRSYSSSPGPASAPPQATASIH